MADASDIAVAEALWKQIEQSFDEDTPHAAYLAHCQKAHLLPEAARNYRGMKDALAQGDPKRERIDKRLAAIAIFAMTAIDEQRSVPRKPKAAKVLALFVALMTLAAAIGLIRALML